MAHSGRILSGLGKVVRNLGWIATAAITSYQVYQDFKAGNKIKGVARAVGAIAGILASVAVVTLLAPIASVSALAIGVGALITGAAISLGTEVLTESILSNKENIFPLHESHVLNKPY